MHLFARQCTSSQVKKTMAKITKSRFELLPQQPYSPDWPISDFYLTMYLDKSYHKKGIKMLRDRWSKCIELKGDYVED